jgi:hypothetical protein
MGASWTTSVTGDCVTVVRIYNTRVGQRTRHNRVIFVVNKVFWCKNNTDAGRDFAFFLGVEGAYGTAERSDSERENKKQPSHFESFTLQDRATTQIGVS